MKELFYYMIGHPNYVKWFLRTFVITDFEGIDKLFYAYLKFCDYLQVDIAGSLDSYLLTDATQDIVRFNIKLPTQDSLDYNDVASLKEAVSIISQIARQTITEYKSQPEEVREFKLIANEFLNKHKGDLLQSEMLTTFQAINDSGDVTKASERLDTKIRDINKRLNVKSLSRVDFISNTDDEDKMEFVAKTGLACIDGDIGGIYAPLIYTINSQPGGGKTRLSLSHFVYPVLLKGLDVIYYELELSVGQVKNILTSYHVSRIYGDSFKIQDTSLNKDELSPEQKRVAEAAKIDLFENPTRGKFSVELEAVAETLYDDVKNKAALAEHLGLIVVDYMGLISSVPQSKYDRCLDKTQRISISYEALRRLSRDLRVPIVAINQFNDAGIDAAYAGRPIKPGMVQGGHEPGRYTDYDLNLTFTEEQKLANTRLLSSASKTRGSKGFGDQLLAVDLSISVFRQIMTNPARK